MLIRIQNQSKILAMLPSWGRWSLIWPNNFRSTGLVHIRWNGFGQFELTGKGVTLVRQLLKLLQCLELSLFGHLDLVILYSVNWGSVKISWAKVSWLILPYLIRDHLVSEQLSLKGFKKFKTTVWFIWKTLKNFLQFSFQLFWLATMFETYFQLNWLGANFECDASCAEN